MSNFKRTLHISQIETCEVIKQLILLGIKVKYINSISFATKFHVGLNEYSNVCDIQLTNLIHCKTTLRGFAYKDYEINICYLGEFSDNPQSKSFICKRSKKELEILNRIQNPCCDCTLHTCSLKYCPAFKNLINKVLKNETKI
jgi:hypothetical protein